MSTPSFIDTHSHLAMLEHDELDNILARAKEAGVTQMLSVSTDEVSWESNRRIAESHDPVFYTLGLHPHDATQWTQCAPAMQKLFSSGVPKKCVAIGEMGMDFHYEYSPKDIQIDVFDNQLAMAQKNQLPVILHCRDAFEQMYGRIRSVGLSPWGGVMHCFTGNTEQAKEALDLGLYISFSGILTFKNAETLREAAKVVPLDRILLETDCPFLTPMPHRGKPNEPFYLPLTAQMLATTLGKSLEEIAQCTSENARTLFSLSVHE